MTTAPVEVQSRETQNGLRYARWAGMLLGLFLIGYGPYLYQQAGSAAGLAHLLRALFYMAYGILLLLPLNRIPSDRAWTAVFAGFVMMTVALVFVLIVSVIFDYMAAAERDERLGVPGKEGTIIFFGLMQIPVHLFLRKPDLID